MEFICTIERKGASHILQFLSNFLWQPLDCSFHFNSLFYVLAFVLIIFTAVNYFTNLL